ncbi:uncharacterized protein LOC127865824 isoform X1 [Dreissena polymorpha]|nr:uncharacterized protein LOC127865824 isoform X1 [Dreissena polymorpha]
MAKAIGLLLIFVCGLTDLITVKKTKAENIGTTTELCAKFLTDKNRISLSTAKKDAVTPCACTEYDMAQDAMFEMRGNCFEEWQFNDGVKQRCCYSQSGKLLTGYPDGGFVIMDGMVISIDEVHSACCLGNNQSVCMAYYDIYPTDDCTRYEKPLPALSWGDPVIQTVGSPSYNYSFNGHGEYVFLKSNNGLEIQTRLDYMLQDNNDSTIFTAVVFKVQNESIQIEFDRSTKSLSLYFGNATLWKKTGECTSSDPIQITKFFLSCLRQPAVGFRVLPKLALNNMALEMSTEGTFMNIKVTSTEKLKDMKGLAGNVLNGSYVSQNGTKYPDNSSEADMFYYGESWSIRGICNQSNFMYNLTGENDRNCSFYNSFSKPRFLESYLGNSTLLFSACHKSNFTAFETTCWNTWDNQTNRECMLTIARTCNITLGKAIHDEVVRQRNELLRKLNNPPHFLETMPNSTKLIYRNTTFSLNLSSEASDENMGSLRFEIQPMLNEMILTDGIFFKWKVGTSLRKNKNRTLRFIVYDEFNNTDDHAVHLFYCGCEEPEDCRFETKDDDTAECSCKNKYWTGDFCEIQSYPCLEYKCCNPEKCNNNTYDGSPCASCPDGWYDPIPGLSIQTCLDLNECNDTSTYNCDHICNNLDGSYNCSCYDGYILSNDNHTCLDIDECASGKGSCTKSKETCMNLPGNYTCVCNAGYTKKSPGAECTSIEGKMYFGYIEYVPPQAPTQTNATLQAGIQSTSNFFSQNLTGTDNFISIEIYQIFVTATNIHLDFILHMNSILLLTDVEDKILKSLKNKDMMLDSTPLGKSVTVNIKSPDQGGLCDVVPKRTDCHEQSTHCVNRDITQDYYDCDCNFGYHKPSSSKSKICEDIDECQLFDTNKTKNERCVHGFSCYNLYGSWNCTCPEDRLWMSVGTPEYPVYRCQGNHSYLGNISFIWDAQDGEINQSVIKSFLTSQITTVFTNKSFDQNQTITVSSLYVSVTILDNTSHSKLPYFNMYMLTYEFRIRMGDPVSTYRLQRIGSERFKNNEKIGVATFQNITFFNESDNELCRRSKEGNCDNRTTECKQENGTTSCECKKGFQPHAYTKYFCEDVNECNSHEYTCSGGGTCQNLESNWTCSCPPYTKLLNVSDTYKECSDEAYYNCVSEAFKEFTCSNGNKSCNNSVWSCDCAHGYHLEGSNHSSTCTDTDECGIGNPCGQGNCSNTYGGYSCKCESGFLFDEIKKSCIDINECDSEKYICRNGDCRNLNGSYECTCKAGFREEYRGFTATICVDIDECTNKSYSCGTKATCTNFDGLFTCDCPHGYKNNTSDNISYTCIDIDECNKTEDFQCINGFCNNTDGHWDCVCDVSKRAHVVNESYIECRDVFQYLVQFEVRILYDPYKSAKSEEYIQSSLIKMLSDIVNGSMNGSVLFPVEIIPERYHYLEDRKDTISVTVNVITIKSYDAGFLKNNFEASLNKSALLTTPSGISGVVSLKKEGAPADLCTLGILKNNCDPNSTKCKQNNDTVKCQCLGGFENRTNIEGVVKCYQRKDPKGDYSYLVSAYITTNNTSNISSYEFEIAVQLQLMAVYSKMFPEQNVWVEILSINGPHITSLRHRRSDPPNNIKVSVEHILHKSIPENKTTWDSKVETFKNITRNQTSDAGFEPISAFPELPLCNVSKMCNTRSTKCNDVSGHIQCECLPEFVNNTLVIENGTLNKHYECYKADDEPIFTSVQTTSPTTSTLSTSVISASYTDNTHSKYSVISVTDTSPPATASASASYTLKTEPSVQTIGGQTSTSSAGATHSTTTEIDVDVKNNDNSNASSHTALIATGASLGSVVLILAIVVIVVCRLRSKKAQDTERIKLRELEKERRNGFDNSLLGRNYLRSDSKQNSMNDLREPDRETDRDDRRNSYYGGPFKPIEPTHTRPFKSAEPEPIWDRNGHVPGLKGRTGSLPDINGHVDMRMAPETRRMSQPRNSDPLYSSPRKDKDPTPTQKPVDNYRQNMVRVFPESGERLPRVKTNQFPRKNANGRISSEPDYCDDPPLSPKPDYNGRPRDRADASRDSGLNGFSRSSGSPEVQRSRESFGYGSLGRGRYRMEDTPF